MCTVGADDAFTLLGGKKSHAEIFCNNFCYLQFLSRCAILVLLTTILFYQCIHKNWLILNLDMTCGFKRMESHVTLTLLQTKLPGRYRLATKVSRSDPIRLFPMRLFEGKSLRRQISYNLWNRSWLEENIKC